jgi:hypothetical protein
MWRSALVRAVALGSVPAVWAVGHLSLGWLYAVSVIVGVASVFFDVAYQSYVPLIVDEDSIEPANARLEASAQIAAAGGPAVAGLLMRIVTAPLVLAVDALAYVLCALRLTTIRDSEQLGKSDERAETLARRIRTGLEFVLRNPVLRRLLITVGVSNPGGWERCTASFLACGSGSWAAWSP